MHWHDTVDATAPSTHGSYIDNYNVYKERYKDDLTTTVSHSPTAKILKLVLHCFLTSLDTLKWLETTRAAALRSNMTTTCYGQVKSMHKQQTKNWKHMTNKNKRDNIVICLFARFSVLLLCCCCCKIIQIALLASHC